MRIGILAFDLNDYHESVKSFYKPLNLKRENDKYTFLDLIILPITDDNDVIRDYDKVQLSLKILEKIDQYMKVRKGTINER